MKPEEKREEFQEVFAQLRSILQPYSKRLKLTTDSKDHYCLNVEYSAKLKKGFPVAWVKTEKNYVGFHLMPIYMFPKLREKMSDKLKARMQGKSCFNFKTCDEALFKELAEITATGFAIAKEGGFGPS